MDLIEDIAMPLPVTIIAEVLGVDPARKEDFKRWSDRSVADVGPAEHPRGMGRRRPRIPDVLRECRGGAAARAARRHDQPSDPRRGRAAGARRSTKCSAFIGLLLIAGNETTTNLLGNAMLALLDNPDQLQKVLDDPSLDAEPGRGGAALRRAGAVPVPDGDARRGDRRHDDPRWLDGAADLRIGVIGTIASTRMRSAST